MSDKDRSWWRRGPDDLVAEARVAYAKGKLGIMFRRCVQALWLNPDHPVARRGVATFFICEGKYPLALLYDPDHPAIPPHLPRPDYGKDWIRQSLTRYIGAPPGDFASLAQRKNHSCAIPVARTRQSRAIPLPLSQEGAAHWLDDAERPASSDRRAARSDATAERRRAAQRPLHSTRR